jgi:hypothetical protein
VCHTTHSSWPHGLMSFGPVDVSIVPLPFLSMHFDSSAITFVTLPRLRFDTATSPYWLTEVRDGSAWPPMLGCT